MCVCVCEAEAGRRIAKDSLLLYPTFGWEAPTVGYEGGQKGRKEDRNGSQLSCDL